MATATKMARPAIVWFRNDLRLHDNDVLLEALKVSLALNQPPRMPLYMVVMLNRLAQVTSCRSTALIRAKSAQKLNQGKMVARVQSKGLIVDSSLG
jgi:deoxyribodipyrimidine photolyase